MRRVQLTHMIQPLLMLEPSKRRLLEIPTDVWTAIKVRAALEGRPIKAVVTSALRMYLESRDAKVNKPRPYPET